MAVQIETLIMYHGHVRTDRQSGSITRSAFAKATLVKTVSIFYTQKKNKTGIFFIFIYSTTKETHPSLLGAIMEIRIKI